MFRKFWEEKWTHWWAAIQIAFAAGVQPVLNDPGVKDYIHQLNLPIWVGLALAVMGAVTFLSMEHKE